MEILHEANLSPWPKKGEPFNLVKGFGKKFWRQKFVDPESKEVAEYVLFSQPDWSLTCPVLKNGDLVLVQERKQGFGGICTGFPGGTLEKGEGFVAAAEREAAQEAGIISDDTIFLGTSFIATRNSPTRYGMFVAINFRLSGVQKLDLGEYVQVIRVTQKEFWQMVDQGKIPCGCSVELAARAVRHGYLDAQTFLTCS